MNSNILKEIFYLFVKLFMLFYTLELNKFKNFTAMIYIDYIPKHSQSSYFLIIILIIIIQ